MKYLFPVIFLLLSGCSSVQTINTEIPQKYIDNSARINSQDATAHISISRKESFFASAAYYWIGLDKITIMALRSGDYTAFKIQPGEYRLTVHCFGDGDWHSSTTSITIQPGEALFFELSPVLKGYCAISPISEDVYLKNYKSPTSVVFGVVPDPNR